MYEGASVLAVGRADHEELGPPVFLVLGLGARNAVATFVSKLSFSNAHRDDLVRRHPEVL